MNLKSYREKIEKRSPEAAITVRRDLAFQIAREFETARIAKGYTQAELARAVETQQSSIARLEAGSRLPSLRFLKKIADQLGAYIELRLHSITVSYIAPHSVVRNQYFASYGNANDSSANTSNYVYMN